MKANEQNRSTQPSDNTPEPTWVKRTRGAAGVASILGIVAVTLLAFDHLKPWWKETIEDARERESERISVM